MGVLAAQDVNASSCLSFSSRPFEGASTHEVARALFDPDASERKRANVRTIRVRRTDQQHVVPMRQGQNRISTDSTRCLLSAVLKWVYSFVAFGLTCPTHSVSCGQPTPRATQIEMKL